MRWRHFVNNAMFGLTGVCAAVASGTMVLILMCLIWKGGGALSLGFLTRLPAPPGESGGMANAIAGSAQLIALAAALGLPGGILGGVYLAKFGHGAIPAVVRSATDLLNGVPSIVIGIFVYAAVALPMRRFSALAGAVALAVILLPIVVRSTEQFLLAVPREVEESALALGASRWKALVTVIAPAAGPGILTGVILALARIAGESAPLLFTSLNNRYWSEGILEPAASLPVTIFHYALSPYEEWRRQAWAAAFLLLLLVILGSAAVRTLMGGRAERR